MHRARFAREAGQERHAAASVTKATKDGSRKPIIPLATILKCTRHGFYRRAPLPILRRDEMQDEFSTDNGRRT
jgi:hypothetical protein